MEVGPGDSIRFFARYGGTSPLHESFSLGVTKEDPDDAAIKVEYDGTLYYIEQRDKWFFMDHDLHVFVDPKLDELAYSYKKS